MFKLPPIFSKDLRQTQASCSSIAIRFASIGASATKQFIIPNLDEFPNFLKSIESKWKVKLMRRFERERYFGSKKETCVHSSSRYILSMFPYPSGRLHLGHVRIYTSGDILARYSKLLSKNANYPLNFTHVINPMGFDSFGLPAENAAKERGLNPSVWTNSNIRSMKQQLDDLGLQFDWREATSNPNFYKWTQEIFLKLMDADLVYKSFAQVNWDPIDKTVLADEQVDNEGHSWRSGALVEKRYYRQWFIKVNAFTNDIHIAEDVDPESWQDILAIQRNWIGQPCGWLFYLPISNFDSNSPDILPIFTKNPALFTDKRARLIISNDHWLEKVYRVSQTGYINNPFTCGVLQIAFNDNIEDSPVNTHATLLPPTENIETESSESKRLNRDQVLLQAKINGFGGYYTSENYRDWLISRQRFWGTPIPAVRCHSCGYKGVSRSSLPVTLPTVDHLNDKPRVNVIDSDDLQVTSPIEKFAPIDWLEAECPSCGSVGKRECETFDTLFDSSWYFLRYATSPLNNQPFDYEKVQPVWCYIGGKEHASMHLFYARFITHFLHSQGQLKFKEPFEKLLVQGVVKSKTYKLNGRYLSQSEVNSLSNKSKLTIGYEKMSKSKGNGVDPQDLIDTYGIDATRFCLMSYANPRTERLWRDKEEEFKDVLSYLRRVALTVQEYTNAGNTLSENQCNSKIKELENDDLESRKSLLVDARNRCSIDSIFNIQETNQFRQYISALHVLTNVIRSNMKNSVVYTKEFAEALAALIVMLNPLTPHFSEELWLHFSKCIINPLKTSTDSPYKTLLQVGDQPWPIPDSDYPLLVKVRAVNSDEYIEKIPISKEELRNLNDRGIAKLVESYFVSKGDLCKINNVQKYNDLLAIVIANIESINRKMAEKRKLGKRK